MGGSESGSRVAVVGGGVMGEAILVAVLAAGWSPQSVVVAERRPERRAELVSRHGVAAVDGALEAVDGAAIVILSVKPQDIASVLAEVAAALTPDVLVVTVAVGLPSRFYEERLPDGVPVVRVMPNTPALVGRGVSAISPGTHAVEAHLATVERVLAATGLVLRVPEKQQDAVAAISGSGPAYLFYLVDALAEAGVLLGLPRYTATALAVGTVQGAGEMLARTGDHPVVLRERVSSPGGTTVAALAELDDRAVRAAFVAAARAARDRSRELAGELAGERPEEP